MNWLKKLLGFADRADAATDRAASALEGLADDLELLRARVRERFGLDYSPEVPRLPESAMVYTSTADPTEQAEEPRRNGRKRVGV